MPATGADIRAGRVARWWFAAGAQRPDGVAERKRPSAVCRSGPSTVARVEPVADRPPLWVDAATSGRREGLGPPPVGWRSTIGHSERTWKHCSALGTRKLSAVAVSSLRMVLDQIRRDLGEHTREAASMSASASTPDFLLDLSFSDPRGEPAGAEAARESGRKSRPNGTRHPEGLGGWSRKRGRDGEQRRRPFRGSGITAAAFDHGPPRGRSAVHPTSVQERPIGPTSAGRSWTLGDLRPCMTAAAFHAASGDSTVAGCLGPVDHAPRRKSTGA